LSDRGADVEEEAQPRFDAEEVRVAVPVDRFAVHVFENDVGLSRRGDARIDQPRDVGVRQAGEDRAFTAKTRFARAADETGLEQLDGDSALEPAVAPPREPDRSHASPAERLDQGVRADRLSLERCVRRLWRLALEKRAARQLGALRD